MGAFVPEMWKYAHDHLKTGYFHSDLSVRGYVNGYPNDQLKERIRNFDYLTRTRREYNKGCKLNTEDKTILPYMKVGDVAKDNLTQNGLLFNTKPQEPTNGDIKVHYKLNHFEHDNSSAPPNPVQDSFNTAFVPRSLPVSNGRCYPSNDKHTTVNEWLIENYELDSNSSVKRITVYRQYYDFCVSKGIAPMNSACFGKALRFIFPDIKTRRLGVRGGSRYHYCGIRLRKSSSIGYSTGPSSKADNDSEQQSDTVQRVTSLGLECQHDIVTDDTKSKEGKNLEHEQNDRNISSIYDPKINCESQQTQAFLKRYKEHCNAIVQHFEDSSISEIERLLNNFWKDAESHKDIIECPTVVEEIKKCDISMYSLIIHQLTLNGPIGISSKMIKYIRQLSKKLSEWISSALENYSPLLKNSKIEGKHTLCISGVILMLSSVSRIFTHQLVLHERLSSLSEAINSIIECPDCASLALADWEEINMETTKRRKSSNVWLSILSISTSFLCTLS